MAITLDGGTGLFDILGKLGYALDTINNWRGAAPSTADTLIKELNDAIDKYSGSSLAVRAALDPILAKLAKTQDNLNLMALAIQSCATNTLIEIADADSPLPERKITNALQELIAQMVSGSETVDANEPSIASVAGTNSGNGAVVCSVIANDGTTLQYALAEDILCTCDDTATVGSERFTCKGEAKPASKLDWRFPAGSGASKRITSVQATDTTNNLVPNGDLDDAAANIPTSWTLVTGTAGTHVLTEATDKYAGTNGVEYAGDGSTLSQLKVALTVDDLDERTPYAINFFAKMSATPGAGVLTVDLYDGSAVINDDLGTANSFTVDLTALATSFTSCSGTFRLPSPKPTTVQLRFRLSTALSSSRSLFFDHVCMQPATQLYVGGPYVAIFGGATNWGIDDKHTVTVTNDYRGAFQLLFDRLFDMTKLGLTLPNVTGGTETINDNLIA